MKKILMLVVSLLFFLSLVGCSKGKGEVPTEKPTSPDSQVQNPKPPTETIKSPFVTSKYYNNIDEDHEPKIVETAENETKKVYVYEMATIRNVPIAYGIGFRYDGTAIENKFTVITIETKTVKTTIQTCTKQIKSTKFGVEVSANTIIATLTNGILDEFALSGEYSESEEKTIKSIVETSEKKVQVSKNEIKTNMDSNSTKYQTGNTYRIVLTSTFKTYLYAIYDKVRDEIYFYYNMEEIITPEQKKFVVEETSNNEFGKPNVVTYKKIDVIDDGIKNIKENYKITRTFTRSAEQTIDKNKDSGYFDKIDLKRLFGYTTAELTNAFYRYIQIDISLDIFEVNNGYQHVFIYFTDEKYYGEMKEFKDEHGPNILDDYYYKHTYTYKTDLARFNYNMVVIRYDSSGVWPNVWKNKNLNVSITISK